MVRISYLVFCILYTKYEIPDTFSFLSQLYNVSMSTKTPPTRVAIYAWGGPGTIRLLQTKYHSPQINSESFLNLYEDSTLARARQLFDVTDAFITYSWGFSDEREQEDYAFLRTKLRNFKQLGIRTHAYVQGLNLVTDDFADQDLFCRDPSGRLLSYSKGRSFTCPNNPHAVAIITNRVTRACQEDVDGIFVDNVLFGLPPLSVRTDFIPFFGCSCTYCQQAFKRQFGYPLPCAQKRGKEIEDFLSFRARTITRLIQQLSMIAHSHDKEFGINLYDPTLRNDTVYYGYSLGAIEKYLDCLLVENHSLPSQAQASNTHLIPLIQATKKPVFVVSYKRGIGMETQFTQTDFDSIYTESKQLGYAPCYKATEFTTNGIWHALDLSNLHHPRRISLHQQTEKLQPRTAPRSSGLHRATAKVTQRLYAPLARITHEQRTIALVLRKTRIYERTVKKPRLWQL